MRLHIILHSRSVEQLVAIILVAIIIWSVTPQTFSLFNNGNVSKTESGATMPLDYEYSAAQWIKQNTPDSTVIISDPVSMEILSGLADRSPLMLLSMGTVTRVEDQIRLILIYELLTTKNQTEFFSVINQLKNLGLTTEQFYHSYVPVKDLSFVIVISQRSSLWIDSKMSYPVVNFNPRNVNGTYISELLNGGTLDLLNDTDKKIYIFKPNLDYFWTAASYCNSTVEAIDPNCFPISFDNLRNENFESINGATQVNGKSGKALFFNGVNDYLVLTKSAGIAVNDSLSIETWIKPGLHMPPEHIWNVIVSNGNPWTYMLFYGNDQRQLYVGVRIAGQSFFASVPFVPDDQWHYLVGIYTDGKLSIYLDGALKNIVQTSRGPIDSTDGPLIIGALGSYLTYPPQTRWSGAINNINIYNRTLSKDEVAERYQGNYPKLARLGTVEIPISVPFSSKIRIHATFELLSAIPSTLTIAILDNKGVIVSTSNIAVNITKQSILQNIDMGMIGPLSSQVNYKIRISSDANSNILLDTVVGKIIT